KLGGSGAGSTGFGAGATSGLEATCLIVSDCGGGIKGAGATLGLEATCLAFVRRLGFLTGALGRDRKRFAGLALRARRGPFPHRELGGSGAGSAGLAAGAV